MDKEQEKIEQILRRYYGDCGITHISVANIILEKLNYRKLPKGKPPLLSDEERYEVDLKWRHTGFVGRDDLLEAIAQAQREADIKHYETHI